MIAVLYIPHCQGGGREEKGKVNCGLIINYKNIH